MIRNPALDVHPVQTEEIPMTTVVAETALPAANGMTITAKLVRHDGEPPCVSLAVGDESGDVMLAVLDPLSAELLSAEVRLLADMAAR